jgi:small GTP-binding protein
MRPIKLITLGSEAVGKTCLLDRWINKTYHPHHDPTIHVGYITHSLVIDGESYTFQLWDTAGQEKYNSVTSVYCRNAEGALVVFDVTSRYTFEAIPRWIGLLNPAGASQSVPIVIAANKTDLTPEVRSEEIAELCKSYNGIQYFETSALNGSNVDSVFEELCRLVIAQKETHREKSPNVNIGEGQEGGKGWCC